MATRSHSTSGAVTGPSRYDLILVVLPLPLLLGGVSGAVSALPFALCVGGGGLCSLAVLAYGLFVAEPTARATRRREKQRPPGLSGRSG